MVKYSYCEVFVKYVLPALRLLIAKELIEKHGFSQLEAAKALGVSQPLINYFIKGKRNPRFVKELAEVEGVKEVVEFFARCIKEQEECREELSCSVCYMLRKAGRIDKIIRVIGLEPESVVYPVCNV